MLRSAPAAVRQAAACCDLLRHALLYSELLQCALICSDLLQSALICYDLFRSAPISSHLLRSAAFKLSICALCAAADYCGCGQLRSSGGRLGLLWQQETRKDHDMGMIFSCRISAFQTLGFGISDPSFGENARGVGACRLQSRCGGLELAFLSRVTVDPAAGVPVLGCPLRYGIMRNIQVC